MRQETVAFFEKLPPWYDAQIEGIFPAPFTSYQMAILWKKKTVVHDGGVQWPDLIHELGHIFAAKGLPNGKGEETDWLGWEVGMVKWLKAPMRPWVKSNSWYETGDHGPLGLMKTSERDVYLREMLSRAKEDGLVSRRGVPQAVR